MRRSHLLVVEDDVEMRGVVSLALRSHGYDVKEAATGTDALSHIQARTPDAVLLDLGLPDIDGFVVTACIRQTHDFPIIVLSARSEEQHQVRALDSGATDYVTKPFREGELMARIRAALRRPVPMLERRELVVGDLRIDSSEREVFVRGVRVAFTPTEFELLEVLARNADRVVTHRQLLRAVWGAEHLDEVRYLRVYVKLLRNKIERNPARPERILTTLGIGYRLVSTGAPGAREGD
ncbi:MAG TPA: response regulator transcription factor [Polyangiaceae bacterium]|nr:response regulator transcription factor [Polyangiaceae bacterium]